MATSSKKASRSGNPAVRAEAQISTAADFKKNKVAVLQLPSGPFVKVKNPGGLKVFLQEGIVPNNLMTVIQKSMETGEEPDMSGIVGPNGVDPESLNDMIQLLDTATMKVMVSPRVHPSPLDENGEIDEDAKDEELLYIDEMDDEDKMFLFQWLTGGTRDVEEFRAELAIGVDNLVPVQDVANKAK